MKKNYFIFATIHIGSQIQCLEYAGFCLKWNKKANFLQFYFICNIGPDLDHERKKKERIFCIFCACIVLFKLSYSFSPNDPINGLEG